MHLKISGVDVEIDSEGDLELSVPEIDSLIYIYKSDLPRLRDFLNYMIEDDDA